MFSLEKFAEDYKIFTKALYDSAIQDLFVDLQVSKDSIDHVARRASTLESYQELTQLLREKRPTFFYESIVNDRPIAIVALKQELLLEDYKINIIEIISPKPNKSTGEGFQHIEVLVNVDKNLLATLQNFVLENTSWELEDKKFSNASPELSLIQKNTGYEIGFHTKHIRDILCEEISL